MSDPLLMVQLALRYLHIFGAIALFGGTIFAWFALLPTLASLSEAERLKIHEQVRNRWKWVAHAAATALLLSGIANLGIAGMFYKFAGPYNMLGGIKLLLALPVVFIAMMLTGSTSAAKKFQAKANYWLTINMVLATLIVLIASFMRYIPRELKTKDKALPPAVTEPITPAEPPPAS